MSKKIVVVGAGAAGFFAALTCARHNPKAELIILEKTTKLLSKVKVSGGGRCNVTNAETDVNRLIQAYPRGGKFLKNAFKVFSTTDTVKWFEGRGVRLKSEPDGRMFPVTDDSQTIVDTLLNEAAKLKVKIQDSTGLEKLVKTEKGFDLHLSNGKKLEADNVLIATGGSNKSAAYNYLEELGHTILSPLPSLFTFNIPGSVLKDLPGISVGDATVKVLSSKLEDSGPLLITHWGLSGPAVLKLSAWGARELAEKDYKFKIHVNWISLKEEELRAQMEEIKQAHPKKMVFGTAFFGIPRRLWEKLCETAEISEAVKWSELPKKNFNKLMEALIRFELTVSGKTTFKEEFVTAGGVSLKDIEPATMQSLKCKGLYFAGEVLDIDGITGGYNFQAAWSTGYIAGKAMAAE